MAISDVDALHLLQDGVIEEVGVNNVVQILACSTLEANAGTMVLEIG